MPLIKNTNYANTSSILIITILSVIIVSCRPSAPTSSYSNKEPKKIVKEEHSENSKTNKVITSARSYLGAPYKIGGNSKKDGIDCSGLTCAAYKTANIELPRTSGAQSETGKTIPIQQLKPGDLLFFTDKKGHTKVTHVGMVTEVKSSHEVKFIHASTKGGVVEENLYSEWYISIFLKATRIF